MYRLLFILVCLSSGLTAQDEEVGGFFFGPKAGLTIGTQNWDGLERRAMLNYHGAIFIESFDRDFKGSFFAQLGYLSRGSGLNVFRIGGVTTSQAFIFRNLGLTLGAKKRLLTKTLYTPYYFLGLRGEYQLSNNLQQIQDRYNSPYFPIPVYVNNFTYGFSFGGGIEFLGSDLVHPALELTISPDLSYQYQAPSIGNVINPFNGLTTSVPERSIRNITIEVSLIIRFMRRVVFTN